MSCERRFNKSPCIVIERSDRWAHKKKDQERLFRHISGGNNRTRRNLVIHVFGEASTTYLSVLAIELNSMRGVERKILNLTPRRKVSNEFLFPLIHSRCVPESKSLYYECFNSFFFSFYFFFALWDFKQILILTIVVLSSLPPYIYIQASTVWSICRIFVTLNLMPEVCDI